MLRSQDFWAKTLRTPEGNEVPGISVRDHCLNVGCVAEALIDGLLNPLQNLLPAGTATLAAMHDIGKISPGFQQKCPAWMVLNRFHPQAAETDHAKVSQWFLQHWLGSDARKLRRWLMAVGAHHGQSKGPWIKDVRYSGMEIGPTGSQEWQEAREALATTLKDCFRAKASSSALAEHGPPNDAILSFFAGLIAVADWLASDEHFFSPGVEIPPLNLEQRRHRAAGCLGATGLSQQIAVRGAAFAHLFPSLPPPNSLQQSAADHCQKPGLWIIEAPMGCGKTEAALLAASSCIATGEARGLFFALPTQTTSNRIYERVEKWLEKLLQNGTVLRLAHGASWLEDGQTTHVQPSAPVETKAQGECENPWAARYWLSSARRALLAPFGVGTVDQALLGVVAAKHFFVRLFGLAGKVVVLDEVHSYDLYTGTLVDVLVEQLLQLRCTVIVLSATLTRQRREELIEAARRAFGHQGKSKTTTTSPQHSGLDAYPLLSGYTANGAETCVPILHNPASPKRVRICCRELSIQQAATECGQRAESGQVVLWIRNTVDNAQRSFQATLQLGGPDAVLLHSRFPWFRRDELEGLWLSRLGKNTANRPNGVVVVATQVVEQSVDIDADFLLTDLAPTDMLLQRLGRLWRHGRADRPNRLEGPGVWIHIPECGGLSTIADIKAQLKGLAPPYAAYVLLRSAREWRRCEANGGILLPANIRDIIETTYAAWPDEPQAWGALRREMECRAAKLRNKAVGTSDAWGRPVLPDDEGVQTRFGDYPAATLILLRSFEQRRGEVRLTTLEEVSITAYDHEWSREVAVALHRNHLKIPAWWLNGRSLENPPPLRRYFVGRWALAIVEGDDAWLNGQPQDGAGLKYHSDRGVWREPVPNNPQSSDYEDNYESDE